MKDLKEKIIKILDAKLCMIDRFSEDIGEKITEIVGFDGCSSEITTLINENYYEKDFVEWFLIGNHPFGRVEYIEPPSYVNFKEGSKHKYSVDELYNYWLEKIKDK